MPSIVHSRFGTALVDDKGDESDENVAFLSIVRFLFLLSHTTSRVGFFFVNLVEIYKFRWNDISLDSL